MTPETGPFGGSSRRADSAQGAGVFILAGAGSTILGSAAPWLLKVVFGISVVTSPLPDLVPGLVALTVLSAVIATAVLLRRPPSSAVALGLIALAVAQICLAVWNALSVWDLLAADDPRLVVGRAIGTGVYLALLGASLALAGGILAFRRRTSSPVIMVHLQ